jgi:serine-type D-Ala-D-Ala carboxypeptidase/endopeptidase
MRFRLLGPFLLLVLGCPGRAATTSGTAAAPPATLSELASSIDPIGQQLTTQRWAPGVVVGLIRGDQTWVRGYGRLGPDDAGVPDGDTAFEIGSVTKVFTALLAADAEAREELALDWPVSKVLPAGVTAPEHSEGPITLRHLATHTSGLPRMPSNFAPGDPDDPFADYDQVKLHDFLNAHQLGRAPGEAYAYSNVGMGLLGYLVATNAGGSWSATLAERVLGPLGLSGTSVSPLEGQRAAVGHDGASRPVLSWAMNVLGGAGDLTSTANDMLAFLAHQLDPPEGALGAAIRATQEDQRIAGAMGMGLGWHLGLMGAVGDPLRWHNGQTAGFHSYVAFDPVGRFGVVVLASQGQAVIDTVGAVLVLMLRGEEWALELPESVSVTNEALKALEGDYPLAPLFVVTVRAEGNQLFVQATGQPELPVFPLSDTEFQYRVVAAKLVFELDSETGRAVRLVLHQNGQEMPGDRLVSPADEGL